MLNMLTGPNASTLATQTDPHPRALHGPPQGAAVSSRKQGKSRANFIFLQCIRLLALCHQKGLPFLIEQPEPWGPEDDNGTLFDFPEMIDLWGLPGVKITSFD